MRVKLYLRRIAAVAIFLAFSISVADAQDSKPIKTEEILSLISSYKSWKQVNRFDDDVSAASFKIENAISFGGA